MQLNPIWKHFLQEVVTESCNMDKEYEQQNNMGLQISTKEANLLRWIGSIKGVVGDYFFI